MSFINGVKYIKVVSIDSRGNSNEETVAAVATHCGLSVASVFESFLTTALFMSEIQNKPFTRTFNPEPSPAIYTTQSYTQGQGRAGQGRAGQGRAGLHFSLQ